MNFCLGRNMLSSAHILAMDTKNLLDVCDSIRARYPNVKCDFSAITTSQEQQNARLPQQLLTQLQLQEPPVQEVYENLSGLERVEITEQLYSNQNPPTDIGIYDNQAAIQEQLKIVEEPTSPTSVDSQFSQKILSN